jgi:hypothetical protein
MAAVRLDTHSKETDTTVGIPLTEEASQEWSEESHSSSMQTGVMGEICTEIWLVAIKIS